MGNAWKQAFEAAKRSKSSSKATQIVLSKWLEGNTRGLKHNCFQNWKILASHAQEKAREQKRMEELLNGKMEDIRQQHRLELDEAGARKQAAKQSVELMVKKWGLGNDRGLLTDVFQVWAKYCLSRAADEKKRRSVELSLQKWLEGDKKGLKHSCFLHWKNDAQVAASAKKAAETLKGETQKLQAFLEDAQRTHMTL